MSSSTGSGKIPEYTAEEVGKFLGAKAADISNITEVLLWCLPVVGFLVFSCGLVQVAKESREAALGGGGGRRWGWWMVIGGGGVGVTATILLLLAGFFRPPTL